MKIMNAVGAFGDLNFPVDIRANKAASCKRMTVPGTESEPRNYFSISSHFEAAEYRH